ncbi:D-serine/D-alanine/glycine transporter [Actinobaculum suis]|uniref:Amino acid permease n=1 Tax=Actinobaculum suis TaxID=1657 RepID=A0A1G7BQB7_9ACTO|nr:amino acid permease [Actinobaculum suis]MDY5153812.1 amino acid permease [Actinobaculum suis]SDE29348.1 D-serine/D-alanine/glycine transporter [Actinobaculum suis]VDG76670.1 amino acid permease-associated protein [Actinobaculum suis]
MNKSNNNTSGLRKDLQNRHVQLIAIGGAIGTGLFMGSGRAISLAGPSILLVYALIGAALFIFMRCMGELFLAFPGAGTFSDIVGGQLGRWAGIAVSWTYWLCWIVCGIADVIAITGYFWFWWPDLSPWIPVVGVTIALFLLNVVTVKAFGELEFWFSMIKIVAIGALIVTGLIMVATAHENPNGTHSAVSNLWNYGGIFPNGFAGFCRGFQIAIFAFVGIELVGATVAETANPAHTLPRAINSVPVRILLFYIGALTVIMMVNPWNTIDPEVSPFVTMYTQVGLPAAASIVNLVVITSAMSSANSGIYSTSRMLYGLANQGQAPGIFARLSHHGVPVNALASSCLFLLSGIVLMAMGDSVSRAFEFVTTMASMLFMFVWSMVVISYLRYAVKYPKLRAASTFPVPGGRVSAVAALVFFGLMVVLLGYFEETRIGLVLAGLWVIGICGFTLLRERRGRKQLETRN